MHSVCLSVYLGPKGKPPSLSSFFFSPLNLLRFLPYTSVYRVCLSLCPKNRRNETSKKWQWVSLTGLRYWSLCSHLDKAKVWALKQGHIDRVTRHLVSLLLFPLPPPPFPRLNWARPGGRSPLFSLRQEQDVDGRARMRTGRGIGGGRSGPPGEKSGVERAGVCVLWSTEEWWTLDTEYFRREMGKSDSHYYSSIFL